MINIYIDMEDLLEQTRSHRQMEQSLFFQTPSQSSYKVIADPEALHFPPEVRGDGKYITL